MQHRLEAAPPHLVAQDRRHVGVGVARMDDQRQAGLARRRDVGAEHAVGHVARRRVVVVVEPRLADADAFRVARQRHQPLHRHVRLLGGLQRVGADGEEHVREALRDGRDLGVARDAGRDGDDAATPAARARSTTASSSGAKSGKSRWQWLSVSIRPGRLRLDVAREDHGGRGQGRAGRRAGAPARDGRSRGPRPARRGGRAAGHGGRHHGLHHEGDLAQHLGRHGQDGRHAGRVGLALDPGLLGREVAVGGADHAPGLRRGSRAARRPPWRRGPARAARRPRPGSRGRPRSARPAPARCRRSSWRSSTASAGRGCRCRWRGRR